MHYAQCKKFSKPKSRTLTERTPLVQAEQKGVKVRVILDKSNLSGNNSGIPALQAANIPVWIDYKVKISHNKVMIIDNQSLVTGSFNFTASAQSRNAENVLIANNASLANQYEQNFLSRQSASMTYENCLQDKKCSHSAYSPSS